jgi:hypothetical protein
LARWATRLSEYDMTIHYRRGKEHVHVDTLSRFVEPEEATFPERAFCWTASASKLPTITEALELQKKLFMPRARGYIFRDGIIYYRNGIYAPPQLQTRIIEGCHNSFPLGHCGARKTKTRILRVWNWPGIHDDVAKYVKSCLYCQKTRPGIERLQGLFRPHPEWRAM